MKTDYWLDRWKENQIGFHQLEINTHLERYWARLKLAPEALIFVPLCGKSNDMLWLRGQGHGVLGVEISPFAVRGFFSENKLYPSITRYARFESWEADGIRILCGDFFSLKRKDLAGCSGVYDRASLVAFPPDMRSTYVKHLAEICPKAAKILIVTMEYPEDEMSGPPFSVTEDEIHQLFGKSFRISPLASQEILEENPRFVKKGLSRLAEKVYLLISNST